MFVCVCVLACAESVGVSGVVKWVISTTSFFPAWLSSNQLLAKMFSSLNKSFKGSNLDSQVLTDDFNSSSSSFF